MTIVDDQEDKNEQEGNDQYEYQHKQRQLKHSIGEAINMSSLSPNRSWRQEEEPKEAPHRQKGIPPKSFHTSSHRRARESKLDKVLQESANNVIRQQRKQVMTQIKLKRAAFKEVTSLKTWPLQDLALQDLDQLIMVHLGQQKEQHELNSTGVECHGDSTGLSSSSFEEPKRTRRRDSDDEEDLSPRKSTLRHQFKQQFIKERELPAGQPKADPFHPALWSMEPRVFAVEKSTTGKRKYIVGHLGRFLDYYWRKVDPKQRHYYELIREKTPCRLYFDLEFSKLSNPDINQEEAYELLQDFIEELILEFDRIYGISICNGSIVDLDSSTEKKFSRHLVVHLPRGELFADAAAAGRFVRVFVGRLADEVATGQMQEKRKMLAKHLFVNAPPSKNPAKTVHGEICSKSCFIDLGVYTRNRLFRIMASCKFGKPPSASLRISSSNKFPFPQGFSNDSFYVPAKASEEQRTKDTSELDDDMNSFKSAVDWAAHAEALAATLVVPMNVLKRDFPILNDSEDAKSLDQPDGPVVSSSALASAVLTATNHSSNVQTGESPFHFLDTFVLNTLATRGGVEGSIRGWSIDYDGTSPKSITYQMSRNRWCEAIGRPHKSNNIMWTINLVSMEGYQGCHDPECRALRFRGTPIALPESLKADLKDALFEHELARLAETDLTKSDKTSPKSQFEFDDVDFEKALMALKINGDDTPKNRNTDALVVETNQKF